MPAVQPLARPQPHDPVAAPSEPERGGPVAALHERIAEALTGAQFQTWHVDAQPMRRRDRTILPSQIAACAGGLIAGAATVALLLA